MKKIGLIGGTGLEKLDIFERKEEIEIKTPFGDPSSSIFKGFLANKEVYILSRHGRDHTVPPTQVNNRANIHALKQLGCESVFASSACGSLREDIKRGDLLFPDQFIDFTIHRINTFSDHFEPGKLKHAAMADPFSEDLRALLIKTASELELSFHPKGMIVIIEGFCFSTRAESNMFRLLGADVVNMSIAPEAALANEAGIPYAVIALSTDYDSWKQDEHPVTWEEVLKVFEENVKHVMKLLVKILQNI